MSAILLHEDVQNVDPLQYPLMIYPDRIAYVESNSTGGAKITYDNNKEFHVKESVIEIWDLCRQQ